MAFTLTATARASSKQIKKEPQIIVEVEGIDIVFGSQPILEFLRWDGGQQWDSGLRWDSLIEKENSRNYISLNGTTNSFTQQLLADKGGTGSVSNMNIALTNKNGEIGRLFSFDQIEEVLGRRAVVYLNFANASHPEDSIPIIRGYIDDFSADPGRIDISITHPENLKRQSLFKQFTTQTTSILGQADTLVNVLTTENLIPSRDSIVTYIRVEDEFMEVSSIDSETQLTVIRGRLGSVANSHQVDEDVSSVYVLSGTPIDLALKLMLSNSDNSGFQSMDEISLLLDESDVLGISNSLIFDNPNIVSVTGLTVGDKITISNSQSNDGEYTFLIGGTLDDGRSFISLEESIVPESGENVDWSYKSRFNVLSEGLGLTSAEVDVDEMIQINDNFGAQFYEYTFYIDDTLDDMKSFIDTQIFFPQGMFSIPRKARVSCKISTPPLSVDQTPILNTENIINIEKIKQVRAVHKYYYNEVLYKYNYNPSQQKLLDTFVSISSESKSRIRSGNKTLSIETIGTPRAPTTLLSLGLTSNRILNRYKFAAKLVKGVQIPYGIGYSLETGDTVLMGGEDTQLVNLQTGERNGPLTAYEVINKQLSVKGDVKIDLLEAGFGIQGRFAVFSPSSKTIQGSTESLIIVGNTFECFDEEIERRKYEDLIGVRIRVRSEDFDFDELTTIDSLSQVNPNGINVSPPLSRTDTSGLILELANYDEQPDGQNGDKVKIKYTFTTPRLEILTVNSLSEFEVNDASVLRDDMLISVHSEDFDRDSKEVEIQSVTGNIIQTKEPLLFTPLSGDFVEVLSFTDGKDNGYRFI